MTTETRYRVCPLCEATCGIAIQVEDGRVTDIRGDKDDPFSRGYICPKAHGLKSLQEDPDRLRKPLRRTASGWQEISWDAAFDETITRLRALRDEHGKHAIATYIGNPAVHNLHAMTLIPALYQALGTQQRYSASSVDQLPKMVSAGLMFGGGLIIPIPDIDRTSYMMILGGNPIVSNGSLMTAPDIKRRLDAVIERGGKVVVIDPRRTETAQRASEHHFIRPGTDALLLLAMAHVMFEDELVDVAAAAAHVRDGRDALARVRDIASEFSPDRVADRCGIDRATIARMTRELCAAEGAVCYGRIGTTCQEFGTLASWAVDVVNILSGNLDQPGGAMFPRAAAVRGSNRVKPRGKEIKFGRWHSRVKQFPEKFGELPVATLADEILTPGDDRVRGMVTVAGNPLLSAPGSQRLAKAFGALDFMVSIDFYRNETTRFADIILPPPSPLERDGYDLAFYRLSIRDVAKYSAPTLPRPDDQPDEWEILLTLVKGMMGQEAVPLHAADEFFIRQLVAMEVKDGGRWDGLTQDEALGALASRRGPTRALDLLLRLGPYGDGFGRDPDGISLDKLIANPHGIDLGPLKPQLPGVLRTVDGMIDLTPALIVEDIERLRASLTDAPSDMVLIGRRHLRSNNSWMHNLTPLVKGRDRCTLLINDSDAARLGLSSGDRAQVTSRAGTIAAPVELTADIMPGVVSLPHGWGHDSDGAAMRVAAAHPGVNVNVLSDDQALDVPSGNAALNGVPVTVAPA